MVARYINKLVAMHTQVIPIHNTRWQDFPIIRLIHTLMHTSIYIYIYIYI